MKKLLVLSLLVFTPLCKTTPSDDLEKAIRLTQELQQTEKDAQYLKTKEQCCYACGCCTEMTVGYVVQDFTKPSVELTGSPAYAVRLYAGALLGFLGYGFTHIVSYPSSKYFHEQALEAHQKADTLRSQLTLLPAVTMISDTIKTVRHR